VLLRKSTAVRLKRRLWRLPHLFRLGKIGFEQFRSSVASAMGWLKWACSRNLRAKLGFDKFGAIMDVRTGKFKSSAQS
jgi:hypothetical protein